MRKKYSIKKHGNTFKVFEHLTKQFIAQSKNRNVLTKLLVKLNKGAFFNGDTPRFMLLSGPIIVHGQRNTINI